MSWTVTELNPMVYELVPPMAASIARRFRAFVEADDVQQECYKWAVGRSAYINEQLDENHPEYKHNIQRVAWQMRRAAERYARREKAIKSGYQPADEAYYESATLGQLLPFVIASVIDGTVLEQAQEMIIDSQPKGSSSPAEGGNLLATLFDIKKCYLKLEEQDRTILIYRYHENLKLAQIGEILGCHYTTADRRCTSALRRLIQLLGGETPWK